eukprot:TRINITY_DN29663_c0_g1_i2.p1 TRINITY_DN29663_c0_g1~~TRINITY_DN29663_c0_g1_i2.p1  ORF type:complete len:324 (+),score=54.57 TRINITY_DN29663_c0_g1_i2:517-1488(+)
MSASHWYVRQTPAPGLEQNLRDKMHPGFVFAKFLVGVSVTFATPAIVCSVVPALLQRERVREDIRSLRLGEDWTNTEKWSTNTEAWWTKTEDWWSNASRKHAKMRKNMKDRCAESSGTFAGVLVLFLTAVTQALSLWLRICTNCNGFLKNFLLSLFYACAFLQIFFMFSGVNRDNQAVAHEAFDALDEMFHCDYFAKLAPREWVLQKLVKKELHWNVCFEHFPIVSFDVCINTGELLCNTFLFNVILQVLSKIVAQLRTSTSPVVSTTALPSLEADSTAAQVGLLVPLTALPVVLYCRWKRSAKPHKHGPRWLLGPHRADSPV